MSMSLNHLREKQAMSPVLMPLLLISARDTFVNIHRGQVCRVSPHRFNSDPIIGYSAFRFRHTVPGITLDIQYCFQFSHPGELWLDPVVGGARTRVRKTDHEDFARGAGNYLFVNSFELDHSLMNIATTVEEKNKRTVFG